MKKLFFFIALMIGNCLLDSCCKIPDTCIDIQIDRIGNFSFKNNLGLDNRDSLDAGYYGIILAGERTQEYCTSGSIFGSSLFAFSCDGGDFRVVNEVAEVSITSTAAFSINYPAGSELSELFVPYIMAAACLGETSPESYCAFPSYEYLTRYPLEKMINENGYLFPQLLFETAQYYLIFGLNTEEEITANFHTIKVVFTRKDGSTTELDTEEVFLY
jgi:hypothetical protein